MALKPRIAESPQVRLIELKSNPFFIVASVEVGNTTTKCILTATNMDNGMTHIINKVVRMTRDICPPKPGEAPFGKTLTGVAAIPVLNINTCNRRSKILIVRNHFYLY